MKDTTLAFLVRENEVLLAIKKVRKLGHEKYNGYGGHAEEDETIEEAMIRELQQESTVLAINYKKVGEMYYEFPKNTSENQLVHIYLVDKWLGKPKDTPEMIKPTWFRKDALPFDSMWDNDKYWLPHVLDGRKIRGHVVHDDDRTLKKSIEIVDSL